MSTKTPGRITIPKLQQRINLMIHYRDTNDQGMFLCCSCRCVLSSGILQAGHFIATGVSSFLRFYPKNIHGECHWCNCHDSSHLVGYKRFMIRRYGEELLEKLERFKKKALPYGMIDEIYQLTSGSKNREEVTELLEKIETIYEGVMEE